jgi:hypothetical protein
VTLSPIRPFDAGALYQALDARRAELGLSWPGVAHQIWQLSADLNDRRLRWALKLLYASMDEKRRQDGLTWPALAALLGCTPSQLTGLRTAKFATGMDLAMRIVQWLGHPAADFVYPARW